METYFFLAAIGAVIWLIRKWHVAIERLAHTEQALERIEARLRQAEFSLGKLGVRAPTPEQADLAIASTATTSEPQGDLERQDAGPPAPEPQSARRSAAARAPTSAALPEPASVIPPPLPFVAAQSATDSPAKKRTKTTPERVATEFPLTPLLRKLNLLPPSGETAEAALASWWLTRVGLVILIIAAVFFGVRIAAEVPPIVRVVSVAAVALGMIFGGTLLEKRVLAFGRLVSAGGLALGYFTTFAAYGIEGMKIIESPVIGLIVQAISVVAIIVWSARKKDERVASMGVLLGYVVCGFSHSHNLDQFVVLGLLMLAAGAGFVQITQRWLWPLGIATVGSWAGFLVLGVLDWPQAGEAPSLTFLLISLLGLMVLLEATSFISEDRANREDHAAARPRHWLAILNTSFAALVSWLVVRQVFPQDVEVHELDATYLALALAIGAFAALRYWRKHSVNLTQAYFLKASALLALFVVEAFDGPTRWLSLAIQTMVLLWAYRQSRLRWIEVGFAALLACTLAAIAHDALAMPSDVTRALWSVTHVIGAISLVLLSTALGLHARWFGDRDSGIGAKNLEGLMVEAGIASGLRFVAGALVGGVAVLIALPGGFDAASPSDVGFLSVLALLIGAPAIPWREVPPVIAGLVTISAATAVYAISSEAGGIGIGLWLTALGFGMSEVAMRLWKNDWALGHGARMILHAVGSVALAFMLSRSLDDGNALNVLALLGFAAAGAWALMRQSRTFPANHDSEAMDDGIFWQWILAGLIGLLTLHVGEATLGELNLGPSWLAVAGAVLFLSALSTKNAVPALAGGIPLVAAVALHPVRFDSQSAVWDHLGAAALIIGICSTTAVVLWRKVDARHFRGAIGFDAVLHILALLVLHWVFRSHLTASETLFADALTALTLVLIHLRFPLPTLNLVSAVPMIVGGLRIETASISGSPDGADAWWTMSAIVILGWLWVASIGLRQAGQTAIPEPTQREGFRFAEGIAAILLTMAGFRAAADPWSMVALGCFGVALASLGRWGKLTTSPWLSILPMAAAVWAATEQFVASPPASTLTAMIVTAVLIVLHGVVLCWRFPNRRAGVWAHGLIAIMLLFPAFASNRIGVGSMATVCWGLTAIGLFIVGLSAGLRPYRLAGLIGLVLAMGRMFLIDIDDALYRIYAFFGISLVLLGMGYLYQRFRHLIDGADHPKPPGI